jgi:hypothetical protein
MTPTRQVRSNGTQGKLRISKLPHFLVGRDRSGQWVVRDTGGRGGGILRTRDEALRFAWHERGDGPGAVILVPDLVDLFEAATDPAPPKGTATSLQVQEA